MNLVPMRYTGENIHKNMYINEGRQQAKFVRRWITLTKNRVYSIDMGSKFQNSDGTILVDVYQDSDIHVFSYDLSQFAVANMAPCCIDIDDVIICNCLDVFWYDTNNTDDIAWIYEDRYASSVIMCVSKNKIFPISRALLEDGDIIDYVNRSECFLLQDIITYCYRLTKTGDSFDAKIAHDIFTSIERGGYKPEDKNALFQILQSNKYQFSIRKVASNKGILI